MSKLLSTTPDFVVSTFNKSTEDLVPGSIFTAAGLLLDTSRGGTRRVDATVSGIILSAYSVEDKEPHSGRQYTQRYVRLTDGTLVREDAAWV